MGVLRSITEYSEGIVGGKIPACKKHQWACLRFLNDLKRVDWEWVFDEERAEDFIEWMGIFKHSRGELAGQPKIPCDYEKFVYGNIYGWVSGRDGSRRFRRSYEQLARKQAKSQDKAIQALYEMSLFGEKNAEVYVAATKKEQTRYIWNEADWLLKNCGNLKDHFTCAYDKSQLQSIIRHTKSGGTFARLSKVDAKGGDGSNPHFGIIDEYHLHETDEYYDMLTSGMKTRRNPLLSIITTAGFDLNNPCYSVVYKYVSRILNPDDPTEDDRFFGIICELDRNETDEPITTGDGRVIPPGGIIDELGSDEAIMKSNPVTGMSKAVRDSILIETKEARQKPEKMRDVLTKTYNVWVQSRPTGYMDMDRWGRCKVDDATLGEAIKKAEGRCYVGIDLSAKLDLTSVGIVFPFNGEDDNKLFALVSHSFIPEDKFYESKDNVPYGLWRQQGLLTVTDGATVDHRQVLKWIEDTIKENGWKAVEVCVDPWGATAINNEMMEAGFKVVEIVQGIKTLSEPTKSFREAVYSRRVIYAENPLLSWAVGNAVTKFDHNQNIMLDKSKSTQRIDPVAAMMNAFTRAMVDVPEWVCTDWGVMYV